MKRILFISAIIAMAMTACGTKKAVKTFDFAGKTLQLVEIGGQAYAPESTVRPAEITFNAEGHVAGKTGCNLFNGSYYANADTLRFPQPMAMTRMMCDETSNNIEMAMTQLLDQARHYKVDGNRISIYSEQELLGVFNVAAPAQGCCKADASKKCCKGDSAKVCCKGKADAKCVKDSTACKKVCTKAPADIEQIAE